MLFVTLATIITMFIMFISKTGLNPRLFPKLDKSTKFDISN